MKPGEIWGYTDPKSGRVTGWKVSQYFPPMGESPHHIAWARRIKDPDQIVYTFVVTPEGVPMLKDGKSSPNWTLIEAGHAV